MKITAKEVRYVAGLANLRLADNEVEKLSTDLEEILTYVDKLNELDTAHVEPMAQVLYDAGETATLRPDENAPSFPVEKALKSAPLSGAGYFKVPLVIER